MASEDLPPPTPAETPQQAPSADQQTPSVLPEHGASLPVTEGDGASGGNQIQAPEADANSQMQPPAKDPDPKVADSMPSPAEKPPSAVKPKAKGAT